ncbi:hypothetical protein HDU90_006986 [Geranomyces variabilis]|nr:hypothetical protein HDU90_006986 [Geranomyces variabilis]
MVSFDEFYAKAQHVASRLAPNVIPEMFTAPDLLVKEYIRFLYMKYFCNDWSVNGRIQIFTAPEEIQAVWDQHILDTKHYFEDVVALCELFGINATAAHGDIWPSLEEFAAYESTENPDDLAVARR